MQMYVSRTPAEAAVAAARKVAQESQRAMAMRGRFTIALSGGSTPWAMLDSLVALQLDWKRVHLFQVDERRAPNGAAERNWTHIHSRLQTGIEIPRLQCHPMPVLDDQYHALRTYGEELRAATGSPVVLDLAQLGLGDDGHTASLVPGDAVLDVVDRDVAWTTQAYRGSQRMTLTFACLGRARCLLWLVTGAAKADMVARLCAADPAIPAGRLPQEHAVLFLDEAAATGVR